LELIKKVIKGGKRMAKKRLLKKFSSMIMGLSLVGMLAACGGDKEATTEENAATSSNANTVEDVKLVLNWFPKSEHGGPYAALEKGIFEEKGLHVSIEPGGPQVSAIQIVASGKAEFGMAHADQLLIARNQGIELVAIAATFQNSPQAFMFHEGVEINGFEDLNNRDVYIQSGITYWDYLKSKYDLSKVNELAYTGSLTTFTADKESVSQSFVTSEPISLELEGVKTNQLLISESGYDPYNAVVFTTKEYIEENPEAVKNFVSAYVEGWNYYKDHSTEINDAIVKENKNLDKEELNIAQEKQKEFVYGGEAAEHGVGYMSEDRWSTLIDQISESGLLKEKVDPSVVYTTEFLPQH
jgi:NitT/TauT family transport system substrate-binding protein